MKRPFPVWLSIIVAVLAIPAALVAMCLAVLVFVYVGNAFEALVGDAKPWFGFFFLALVVVTVVGNVYMWCREI